MSDATTTTDPVDPAENQEGKSLDELTEGTIEAPATEEEIMAPVDFKTGCQGMRADIELIKSKVKNWMSHPELTSLEISDVPLNKREEMEENLYYSYRCLEDARMRLGKAIQAYDGGTSCYPK
jgi:hypothetical protein